MAETTPGPLIQVVQFVGFMAAYRDPGGLNPWVAAVLAACLVTWVTYVPCFLWIFLGAPARRGCAPTTGLRAVAVTAAAAWLLFRRKWSVLRTLGACAALGAAIHVIANV